MSQPIRIDALRSAVEAAGMAMAPSSDQFAAEPDGLIVDIAPVATASATMDAGNYSRSWARPGFRDGFARTEPQPSLFKQWFSWTRVQST
jgi:hypothetical protein